MHFAYFPGPNDNKEKKGKFTSLEYRCTVISTKETIDVFLTLPYCFIIK